MAILLPSSLFPSFAELASSDEEQTCLYYTKTHNRCRNPSGRDKKRSPGSCRAKILQALQSESDELDGLLREYATRCCCLRNHQRLLPVTAFLEQLCSRWKLELQAEDGSAAMIDVATETQVESTECSPRSQRAAQRSARTVVDSLQVTGQSSEKITSTCNAEFQSYRQKVVSDPIYNTLKKELGSRSLKTGTLYLFTRPSNPGMVKIGFTTKPVQARMDQIQRTCHYSPEVQHSIPNLPHVFRIEQLVHAELGVYWRKELKCKHNPDCAVQHKEWFEIDVAFAKDLMNKWAHWMISASPYDANGFLKAEWVTVCRRLRTNSGAVTAQTLIDELPISSWQYHAREPESVTKLEEKAETVETRVVRPQIPQKPVQPPQTSTMPSSPVVSATVQPQQLEEAFRILTVAWLEIIRRELAFGQTSTAGTTPQSITIPPILLQTDSRQSHISPARGGLHAVSRQVIPTAA